MIFGKRRTTSLPCQEVFRQYKATHKMSEVSIDAIVNTSTNTPLVSTIKIDGFSVVACFEPDWQAKGYPARTICATGKTIYWDNYVTNELDELFANKGVKETTFIMAEFYAIGEGGKRLPLGEVRHRVESAHALGEDMRKSHRLALFELVQFDGRNLEGEDGQPLPYWENVQFMDSMLGSGLTYNHVIYAEQGDTQVAKDMWEKKVMENNLEGLVVHRDGTYKVKVKTTYDVAVIGVTINDISWNRGEAGSLVFAFVDEYGNYVYAGKVGTGFMGRQRGALSESQLEGEAGDIEARMRYGQWWFNYFNQIETVTTTEFGGNVLLAKEPQYVIEVSANEWWPSKNSPVFEKGTMQVISRGSNIVGQKPRLAGIRLDKEVNEIDCRISQIKKEKHDVKEVKQMTFGGSDDVWGNVSNFATSNMKFNPPSAKMLPLIYDDSQLAAAFGDEVYDSRNTLHTPFHQPWIKTVAHQYFEFVDQTSNKFYRIELFDLLDLLFEPEVGMPPFMMKEGKPPRYVLMNHWGRIGSAGFYGITGWHVTAQDAMRHFNNSVRQRISKGYQQVPCKGKTFGSGFPTLQGDKPDKITVPLITLNLQNGSQQVHFVIEDGNVWSKYGEWAMDELDKVMKVKHPDPNSKRTLNPYYKKIAKSPNFSPFQWGQRNAEIISGTSNDNIFSQIASLFASAAYNLQNFGKIVPTIKGADAKAPSAPVHDATIWNIMPGGIIELTAGTYAGQYVRFGPANFAKIEENGVKVIDWKLQNQALEAKYIQMIEEGSASDELETALRNFEDDNGG